MPELKLKLKMDVTFFDKLRSKKTLPANYELYDKFECLPLFTATSRKLENLYKTFKGCSPKELKNSTDLALSEKYGSFDTESFDGAFRPGASRSSSGPIFTLKEFGIFHASGTVDACPCVITIDKIPVDATQMLLYLENDKGLNQLLEINERKEPIWLFFNEGNALARAIAIALKLEMVKSLSQLANHRQPTVKRIPFTLLQESLRTRPLQALSACPL